MTWARKVNNGDVTSATITDVANVLQSVAYVVGSEVLGLADDPGFIYTSGVVSTRAASGASSSPAPGVCAGVTLDSSTRLSWLLSNDSSSVTFTLRHTGPQTW